MGVRAMSKHLLLLATVALIVVTHVAAQPGISVPPPADGNPHLWDRKRRCDQIGYTPACITCEGTGGIPTGDENDKITLTTCSIVANASGVDPKTLIHPVWTEKWATSGYNEVLIGPKVDPFCFQVAPSNQSTGKLCYQKDGGMQTYDMSPGSAKALRDDLILDSEVGKIQSTVIAQGLNLWIVNKFPWYAAGTHQCICTNVHQGSDPTAPFLYPIQYNWTQQMFFMGREKIGVEYGLGEMVLDHWAYGPHHVWSIPETGQTIRMWQPYNGLEVFPEGTQNASAVDPTKFDDIPPTLCKKGGAIFRIGCDDSGLPKPKSTAKFVEKVQQLPKDGNTNFDRAHQIVPGIDYKGATFANMSHSLNKFLSAGATKVKMCDQFSAKELQELSAMLYLARDAKLDDVYSKVGDNRQLRGDLEDIQQTWTQLNDVVEGHEDSEMLHAIQRDGHCHETVMWFVHHLSEDVKNLLGETGVEIPLLTYGDHRPGCATPKHAAHKQVCKSYEEKVVCADCHSNVSPPH